MSLLEVSGIKKIYKTRFGGTSVEALKNVNFTVEKGEYVAIMGESGSGKTTLLNILAALDRPTEGTVILDGMNTGKLCNEALISTQGAWGIKKFMAAAGFIHIENGYSRYCIDYEVNDISANYRPPKNMIECPFMSMWEKLGPDEHKLMADIFITDIDELRKELTSDGTRPRIMVLTEPLCDVETRARLFGDLIGRYYNDHHVIVKPHPRDEVDYSREFPDLTVIKGRFPMEVLNDIAELKVEKLVSVITQVDNIRFADEIEYLGPGFLDAYEAPEIHWQMEIFKEQDKKK